MNLNVPCAKYLEAFSSAHVNDAFLEDDGGNMMMNFMESKGSPLLKVKTLKERGNILFKQGNYVVAAACYDEACKLLGFSIGVIRDYNVESLCDLGVSLNLNLAACALKLLEHEAAKDLCTLVLAYFPHNVKALFRRALAYSKLKMFIEADSDLEKTLLVEPKNKDILKELTVVKNQLAINGNGKRVLEVPGILDGNRIVEEPMHTSITEMNDIMEAKKPKEIVDICSFSSSAPKEGCESSVFEPVSKCTNKKVVNNATDSSTKHPNTTRTDMNIDTDVMSKQNFGDNEKFFSFSKKGGGHSRLKISAHAYEKLLEGKEVSFYQKSQLSTMNIRILKPIIEDVKSEYEEGSKSLLKKKKKKKKRSRRRRHTEIETLKVKNVVADLGKTKATDTDTTDEAIVPSTLSNIGDYEKDTTDKIITKISAESVEILVVEDNTSILENDVQHIPDSNLHARILEATMKKTFKRIPPSASRLYMHKSGPISLDADPRDVLCLKTLASSKLTRLRVQRFRHLGVPTIYEIKNSHSLARFPRYRKTKFNFPCSCGVSLYCSRNNLSNTKRKSVENPDFMNLLLSPTKKQCRNHYSSSTFSLSPSFMLNNFICNYGSESEDSV